MLYDNNTIAQHHNTNNNLYIFLINQQINKSTNQQILTQEFCKRKGDFSCFGDKLPGAQRGSLSKWWLADVSLPDWEHTFVGGVKRKLKGSVMAIMVAQRNEAKQQERAKGMKDKLLQKAASVKEISLSPSQHRPRPNF